VGYLFSPTIRTLHNAFYCLRTRHLHKVTATTESFITSSHRLFDSVRKNVRVVCYQPSFHNCSHIAIFYKFLAATILLQRWERATFAWRRIPWCNHNNWRFLSYHIVVHLFYIRPSYHKLCGDQIITHHPELTLHCLPPYLALYHV
jgi:hypothetical protein